ncbi:hypothetical protein GCM10009838_73970 [Catenulispora subtropica]|uniref:Uncharacterized protein n=1 Tax=Catenulispora subtropica TaxID=450798 RepID=A0ABN2T5H6_9ACTN
MAVLSGLQLADGDADAEGAEEGVAEAEAEEEAEAEAEAEAEDDVVPTAAATLLLLDEHAVAASATALAATIARTVRSDFVERVDMVSNPVNRPLVEARMPYKSVQLAAGLPSPAASLPGSRS